MPKLYQNIGRLFTATGLLHTALGILLFGDHLMSIYSAGLLNGIDRHFDRGFTFWFVFAGLLMILLGYLMDWVVRSHQLRLGGFWLVLLQGIYLVRQADKQPQIIA